MTRCKNGYIHRDCVHLLHTNIFKTKKKEEKILIYDNLITKATHAASYDLIKRFNFLS